MKQSFNLSPLTRNLRDVLVRWSIELYLRTFLFIVTRVNWDKISKILVENYFPYKNFIKQCGKIILEVFFRVNKLNLLLCQIFTLIQL